GQTLLSDSQGYSILIQCGENGRSVSYGSTYFARGMIKEGIEEIMPFASFNENFQKVVYLECTEPMRKI
ncbi:MAG: hypothetical protein KKB25_03465, partial [Nanoarchaeota archaeon]|nr:hypothetical protein [Nanoarchaeota archaeon]